MNAEKHPFLRLAGSIEGPTDLSNGKGFLRTRREEKLRKARVLPMKAIADTGFLVAFGNRNDAYHRWAVDIAERVSEPLLTCEMVRRKQLFIWEELGWRWLISQKASFGPRFPQLRKLLDG